MKISKIIYDTLEKDNKSWIPKRHNPSSASFRLADGRVVGPDLLTSYLKWAGVPPSNPIGAKSLFKMKLGDGAHDQIAKILGKANIKAMAEVPGSTKVEGLKFEIGYRVDSLLEIDGELEVLEFKSSTEDQMLGRGWGIRDKGPKLEAVLQTICYLNVFPGLKRGRILYGARDSGDLLEYEVEKLDGDRYTVNGVLQEVNWRGIISRWQELEKLMETKTAPPPEHKVWLNEGSVMAVKQIKGVKYKSDWECLYSPYKDLIWSNPDNYKYTYNEEFKQKGIL